MNNYIIYEQPIRESLRLILKYEYLMEKYNFHNNNNDVWNTKSAINTILEISEMSSRINLKLETLKELKKLSFHIGYLKDKMIITDNEHKSLGEEIKVCLEEVDRIHDNPCKKIVENDFLMSIRSKLNIPAGDNFFDLPGYLNFLTSNKKFIEQSLSSWFETYEIIARSSKVILNVIRSSDKFSDCIAKNGFYENKVDGDTKIDLIRIKIEINLNCHPVISVNNKILNVIFREFTDNDLNFSKKNDDINFSLSLPKSYS